MSSPLPWSLYTAEPRPQLALEPLNRQYIERQELPPRVRQECDDMAPKPALESRHGITWLGRA